MQRARMGGGWGQAAAAADSRWWWCSFVRQLLLSTYPTRHACLFLNIILNDIPNEATPLISRSYVVAVSNYASFTDQTNLLIVCCGAHSGAARSGAHGQGCVLQ